MIRLYYIKGISRLDTPTFSSAEEQDTFFSDYQVYVPLEGFYVPHFKNNIQLEIGQDIDFNKEINYLSIEFNNKTYYYFIDDVKYVNEGLLELAITMDVIQTYMFDIDFISSEVVRRSINRWTDNNINRNYIRENMASGSMHVANYSSIWTLANEHSFYFVLYKVVTSESIYRYHRDIDETTEANYRTFSSMSATIEEDNDYTMHAPDGYGYILVPYPAHGKKLAMTYEGGTVTQYDYYDANSWSLIHRKYQELPMAVSATIVSGSYASRLGITVTEGTNGILLTATDQVSYPLCRLYTQTSGGFTLYTHGRCIVVESYLSTFSVEDSINFRFTKNTSVSHPFSYYNVPALLDENYMYVEVGERTGSATYPLHRIENPNAVRWFCKCNVADNSRMYCILDNDIYDSQYDTNLTTVHVHSIEQIALFNDYYQQYVASNYSNLTRGLALARQKNEYDFYTGAFIDMPQSVTKGFFKGGAAGGILSGLFTSANVVAEHMQNQYVIDEQVAIKKENLELTPDSEKMGNAGILDIIDKTYYGYIRILYDENISTIAKVYESYGYKCREITNENLLQSNNRYYYDIVQAKNMNICLKNVISDETTLYNIKQRFEAGLRLWHTYSPDNVHIRLRIKDRLLTMGAVCRYDNVEVDFL